MSNNKHHSSELYALKVVQRDFVFYTAALPARVLLPLCSELRATKSRTQPIEHKDGPRDQEGANFVQAIAASQFAQEVRGIQQEPYGVDEPFQRIVDDVRVREIGLYLREESALMPNSVILATREETSVEVVNVENQGVFSKIVLGWDEDEPANIIDGQHRISALRRLIKEGHSDTSLDK